MEGARALCVTKLGLREQNGGFFCFFCADLLAADEHAMSADTCGADAVLAPWQRLPASTATVLFILAPLALCHVAFKLSSYVACMSRSSCCSSKVGCDDAANGIDDHAALAKASRKALEWRAESLAALCKAAFDLLMVLAAAFGFEYAPLHAHVVSFLCL